ncbi:MAG TPA: FGGY family carbohydrate kinase [Acidimicrobiales bacterium]|nr:FGGY family carbohydrate kinase [Acidimicrobiales bacterium]
MILTLDLGTSTTKAVVWDADGPRTVGRAPVGTSFPAAGRAEQDPADWWDAVVGACAAARAASPRSFAAVEAVGCAAARQTFVPVTAAGRPLGPALVWSDRRAAAEAEAMAEGLGGVDDVHTRTGAVLDGAALVAKVAWLAAHEPDRLAAARWLLTPRDLVVWRMTGEVVTDPTMVSAAGLSDATGKPVAELVAAIGDRLPPVIPPDAVAGVVAPGPAAELGLPVGIPVVVGAGDRACEVLGTAASTDRPMVSWGTTANVSVPVGAFPVPVPAGLVVTGGASGGWLLEGGLSAAGSFLTWLSTLTGLDAAVLMSRAAASPIGAHGVVALPWLGGARAPWWRDRARGGFLGLSFEHDAGDLARAVVESVAREVRRCLVAAGGAPARSLALTGADPPTAPWAEVLTAVTGLPAVRRRSGQAASAGAALLVARGIGADYDLERLDPVADTVVPDGPAVARYAELWGPADVVADTVVALETAEPGSPGARR